MYPIILTLVATGIVILPFDLCGAGHRRGVRAQRSGVTLADLCHVEPQSRHLSSYGLYVGA